MRIDAGFLKHSVRLRIEGFEQQRLLSSCLQQHILLRDIRVENNLSMTLLVGQEDLRQLRKIAGSRYRVTVLSEKGIRPLFAGLFMRKSTVVGLLLFLALLYYQGSFVSEIQIYGYERLQESEIREALAEAGLFEGAHKSVDINAVEALMYSSLDNLSWIGIKYIGNMAEVTLVEGKSAPEVTETSPYTHVIAEKEGYIEKIIPKEGLCAIENGTYVKPGDIAITGIMPIEDKTFQNREGAVRAVHAKGEVWARILYHFTYYQSRYELIKKETGKQIYGAALQIGDFRWDSSDFLWPFDSAVREDRTVLSAVRPIPIKLSVSRVSEVELYRRERTQEEIHKLASAESREAAKENIPQNAQILNNSLKFSSKENIIEVSIMLHALEEIGKEQVFEFTPTPSGIKEDTGGTPAFGESTE